MTNNYVKTTSGEYTFFDDLTEDGRNTARTVALRNATGIDRGAKPPARTGVSVWRRVIGWDDIVEIGEVRDRVPDLQRETG